MPPILFFEHFIDRAERFGTRFAPAVKFVS